MSYRSLRACIDDLTAAGELVRIESEVDPHLEAAEIHRRVNQAGGPAVYYARVKGCSFPMVSNLFGTLERARYMFRDTLDAVRRLIEVKLDPATAIRRPWRFRGLPLTGLAMLPRFVRSGPLVKHQTTIDRLPALQSWPDDGGPFVTLPIVYTEDARQRGWKRSNLGMYRVQLSGNDYRLNEVVGLHYQIHRGIGVHHAAAIAAGEPFRANVFVGGPPSLSLAAVMPLPEGFPEIAFAGALGGRRVRLIARRGELPLLAEADFCISGRVEPDRLLPEGPFGDHLGYYSLRHPFPVLKVERVFHRDGAIWPFTVVGRPPQEDTTFGSLIHEITGPVIPSVLPGVKAVHAVDAAGVHPLLLAIGSERYAPFLERTQPQELLTQANAILGQGQMSLAKYLLIAAQNDDPALDVHDIPAFLRHMLERVDWRRDLHFQTCTTIDTLDYSGGRLNEGSKAVIATAGPAKRRLATSLGGEVRLPSGWRDPRLCLPGVVSLTGPRYSDGGIDTLAEACLSWADWDAIPLVVSVDDSEFAAASLGNFLWVTFTRSNPAADIHGAGAFIRDKHWGCRGPLIIDARVKPWHAPPLVEDAAVARRVDALGEPGGPLHGII